jgi:predicted nucleic acid-binding Zn ribbon protein
MTKKPQSHCPNCGQPASGNFCTGCGAALKGAKCAKCSVPLPSGSKFCNNCGHALGAAQGTGSYTPLIIAAAAAVVLVVVAMVTVGPFGPKPPANQLAAPGVQQVNPNVSSFAAGTPRGEADRYFDQAMRAHEGRDSAQAAFAGGLALGAYSQLPEQDADTRFHMGLLLQITRDYDAILAQADSIELTYPNHLFAFLLRHRAYIQKGNSQSAGDVYRGFLEAYELEIATGKREYQSHGRLIEAFRNEAQQAIGN